MDWIHSCFFSLPEGNCICLFGVQRQHISGEAMNVSVSSHRSHQPTGGPLTARSRRAKKERMGKGVGQRGTRTGPDVAWPLFLGTVLMGHLLASSPATGKW